MYQNETITCSNNCTFIDIDEDDYINCECDFDTDEVFEDEDKVSENEVFSNSTAYHLFKYPDWNIDIVGCYQQFADDVI